MVKNLPAMQEMQVQPLGQEDPLEKGMATHSSILAWRIPWTEEPGWPQSMGSQRVGHDGETFTSGICDLCLVFVGLPRWLSGKESACNTGDTGDADSIPGSGRSPGQGNGNPLQYSWLENPTDRGARWAAVLGVSKSLSMTEQLSTHETSD